jgi:outer membrane protein OmpA-like peptidoglycan-associated protein
MHFSPIIRRLITALLLLLGFSCIKAQIRLAALGGIHSSNFIEKNSIPGFDTTSGNYHSAKTGFELGFLAEIPLGGNNLFFQPGIVFSAKGNQYERSYDSAVFQNDTLYNQHTLELNYVELPLYLTWKLPLSKDHRYNFYAGAGPYFAFIYGASQSYQNRVLKYNASQYTFQSGTIDLPVGNGPQEYKTFDMGICVRAGFELGNVLLSAYFSRGLTNAYTALYPSSFHNMVAGGSIGIWLNNPKPVNQPPKDTDKDGTPDAEDSCVSIPGSPRWHGCPVPDSDLDGVNDESDSCKSVPGPARYHGCPIPDTDLDGVNDEEDSCKNTPGSEKYHGCPIPDRDQDGINDELDKCPDLAGPAENQGCPVAAINKRAQLLAASIMFKSNSTELTKNSYPAIRELADSLKTNPDMALLIEGHTDNTGAPAYNMTLSIDRGNAVKKVLLSLGIAENRIQVHGYGDTRPIANNTTKAGKAQNRRVVCIFQLNNR